MQSLKLFSKLVFKIKIYIAKIKIKCNWNVWSRIWIVFQLKMFIVGLKKLRNKNQKEDKKKYLSLNKNLQTKIKIIISIIGCNIINKKCLNN